ncbi:MAG TPA: hypothetical protein VHB47_04660 [Thermoanaerobaculia bacterium]|jgi:hypothetical protein|nr:hypothetical protein [Thermoanaerobaculia bacterium]
MAARLVARDPGLAELNAGGAAGGLAERLFRQGTEGFAVEREPVLLLLHQSYLPFSNCSGTVLAPTRSGVPRPRVSAMSLLDELGHIY